MFLSNNYYCSFDNTVKSFWAVSEKEFVQSSQIWKKTRFL